MAGFGFIGFRPFCHHCPACLCLIMFKIKPRASQPAESIKEDAAYSVDQDLIVRNMPKAAHFEPAPRSAGINSATGSQPAKANFKLVGFLIIISGAAFIGLLIFLSYRFIIRPSTQKIVERVETPSQSPTSTSSEINATASSPVAVEAVPEVPETATSQIDVIPGESDIASSSQPEAEGPVVELPPLLDSDQDGLYDPEEAVFGTDPGKEDSDADSYLDSAEIKNGYNPAGAGRLTENSGLQVYNNSAFAYRTLVPAWPLQLLNEGDTVLFSAPDDSLIQISVQDNTRNLSILNWYSESFPGLPVTYDKLKNADGWEGIWSEDKLNFYLTDAKRERLYVVSYIAAVSGRLAYPTIFSLVIDNFQTE